MRRAHANVGGIATIEASYARPAATVAIARRQTDLILFNAHEPCSVRLCDGASAPGASSSTAPQRLVPAVAVNPISNRQLQLPAHSLLVLSPQIRNHESCTTSKRAAGVFAHVTSRCPARAGIGDFGPAATVLLTGCKAPGNRFLAVAPANPIGPRFTVSKTSRRLPVHHRMALEPLIASWLARRRRCRRDSRSATPLSRLPLPWRIAQLRLARRVLTATAGAAEHAAFAAFASVKPAGWMTTHCSWRWNRRQQGTLVAMAAVRDREPAALKAARGSTCQRSTFLAVCAVVLR